MFKIHVLAFFLSEFIFMSGTNKCFTNKNYCFMLGLVLEINGKVTNPSSIAKGNCRAPKNANGNFSFV